MPFKILQETSTSSVPRHCIHQCINKQLAMGQKLEAVFTKGLSQVLGLAFVQKYSQLKPETWLRPFVNTAPGLLSMVNYRRTSYYRPGINITFLRSHDYVSNLPIGESNVNNF